MNSNSSHDLDRLIEEALRSEPLQPLPDTFEQRMQRSLRMAARIERERLGLRRRLMLRLQLIAATVLAIGAAGASAGLTEWLRQAPGAMGFLDYASTDTLRVFGVLPGAGALALLAPLAFAILLPALPALRARVLRTR